MSESLALSCQKDHLRSGSTWNPNTRQMALNPPRHSNDQPKPTLRNWDKGKTLYQQGGQFIWGSFICPKGCWHRGWVGNLNSIFMESFHTSWKHLWAKKKSSGAWVSVVGAQSWALTPSLGTQALSSTHNSEMQLFCASRNHFSLMTGPKAGFRNHSGSHMVKVFAQISVDLKIFQQSSRNICQSSGLMTLSMWALPPPCSGKFGFSGVKRWGMWHFLQDKHTHPAAQGNVTQLWHYQSPSWTGVKVDNQCSSLGLICCCWSRIHPSKVIAWGVAGGGWEAPALPGKPLTTGAETPHNQKPPDSAVPQPPISLEDTIQSLPYCKIKNITGKLLNQAHIAFSGVYSEGSMFCLLFATKLSRT